MLNTNNIAIDKVIGLAEAVVVIEDEMWAVAYNFNLLYHVNLHSGVATLVSRIPNEEHNGKRLYGSIVYYDDKLFLIPMTAREIAVYDLSNNQFSKIPFITGNENKYQMYKERYKFCGGVVYEHFLYIFSSTYPAILKIRMSDYSIEYLDDWVNDVEKCAWYKNEVYFRSFKIHEGIVYLPSCCANQIMKFDLNNNTVNIVTLKESTNSFSDIVVMDDRLIVSAKTNSDISLFNKEYDLEKQIRILPPNPSVCAFEHREKCVILPSQLTHFIILTKEGVVKRIEIKMKELSHIAGATFNDGYIYSITNRGQLLIINAESLSVEERGIFGTDLMYLFLLEKAGKMLIAKEGELSLRDYIEYICI